MNSERKTRFGGRNSLLTAIVLCLVLLCALSSVSGEAATIYYVSNSGDGSIWKNVNPNLISTDLNGVINIAEAGDEIWVAAGTYRPTEGDDQKISFTLKDGLALYGGFAGTESSSEDRNPSVKTILTGDIGTHNVSSDNSYHVISCNNVGDGAVIDGFTITGGNAAGNDADARGGGMYNYYSSPLVTACTFRDNSAKYGGAMYNNYSSPSLTACTFSGNSANDGGAMYNNHFIPSLTACTFSGNSANNGGAMYNYFSVLLVTACTFSGNNANSGGAMYNEESDPSLTACTFSGNSGGAMYNYRSDPSVKNCILWGSSNEMILNSNASVPIVSYCVIKGDYADGTHIISSDPMLDDLADNGGPTWTCALRAASPAIDAGLSLDIASKDQRGVTRPQGLSYDIGAYEYRVFSLTVAKSGTGTGEVSPDVGTHLYLKDTEVTLSVDVGTDSTFAGWSGGIGGTENPVTITMSKDVSVSAAFALKSPPEPTPPTPTPDPKPTPTDPTPDPQGFPPVPDVSALMDAVIDGTVSLDFPEGMTGLSFDSFSSVDVDLSSKIESVAPGYASSDVVSNDIEGTFITGISFDIEEKRSPDLGKIGLLPLDVTLNISESVLSSTSTDIDNLLSTVEIFKIIGSEPYSLMDIAAKTGLPLGDFFSVSEDKSGNFYISFGLLVADAPAGDIQPVQAVTAGSESRFMIFDGKTDGRFTDPLVAVEKPENEGNVYNNGSGGCSAAVLLPSMALLIVPLVFLCKKR